MKKLIVFLLLSFVMLFSISCSKDDSTDPEVIVSPDLKYVGEWEGKTDQNGSVKFIIEEYEDNVYLTKYDVVIFTYYNNSGGGIDTSFVGHGWSCSPLNTDDACKLVNGAFNVTGKATGFQGIFEGDNLCRGSVEGDTPNSIVTFTVTKK